MYQDFRSKIFCVTVPKLSVGEFLFVALLSGSEKVWIGWGSVKIFRRKFFFHRAEKFCRGVLYFRINFGY